MVISIFVFSRTAVDLRPCFSVYDQFIFLDLTANFEMEQADPQPEPLRLPRFFDIRGADTEDLGSLDDVIYPLEQDASYYDKLLSK